jgi:hypothetical protein
MVSTITILGLVTLTSLVLCVALAMNSKRRDP